MTPPTCRPSSLAQSDGLLIYMRLREHCRLLSASCAKAARLHGMQNKLLQGCPSWTRDCGEKAAPEEMDPLGLVALWSQSQSLGAEALASLSSHALSLLDCSEMSKDTPVKASLQPMTLTCRAGKRREAGNSSWWLGVWGHEWLHWWSFRP